MAITHFPPFHVHCQQTMSEIMDALATSSVAASERPTGRPIELLTALLIALGWQASCKSLSGLSLFKFVTVHSLHGILHGSQQVVSATLMHNCLCRSFAYLQHLMMLEQGCLQMSSC